MGWKEKYYKVTFKNIPNIFRLFGFIIYTKNAPNIEVTLAIFVH